MPLIPCKDAVITPEENTAYVQYIMFLIIFNTYTCLLLEN